VPGRTGSSRKPGSSQIFCHPGTSGHVRTTARTWTTGLAAAGPGQAVMEPDRHRNGQTAGRVGVCRVGVAPSRPPAEKDLGNFGLRGRKGGLGSTRISTKPGSSTIFQRSRSITVPPAPPISLATTAPGHQADPTRTRAARTHRSLLHCDSPPQPRIVGIVLNRNVSGDGLQRLASSAERAAGRSGWRNS
jgi:hypothetical protein